MSPPANNWRLRRNEQRCYVETSTDITTRISESKET